MISQLKNIYFVLSVAFLTFFGLPIFQNTGLFSELSASFNVTLNLTAQPEEEESQGAESWLNFFLKKNGKDLQTVGCMSNEQKSFMAFTQDFLFLHPGHFEVFSPPPKA